MEQDVYDIATEFRNIINVLVERVTALEERNAELEKTVFDDILQPAKDAMDKADYDAFKERYAESLGPLENGVKAVQGADFDIYKTAKDGFATSDIEDEAEYVNAFVESVKGQLDEIKNALGVDKVEVVSEPNGEVEVKADDQPVETEAETEETTEETEKDDVEEDIDYSKYM